MTFSLFITGATGFIGSHLIQKLNPAIYHPVYCLSRSAAPVTMASSEYGAFHWTTGHISHPETYSSALESCDTVIHLAAVTGKAPVGQYSQVNAKGTQTLIQECERRGVKNFLFVSTIAVKYQNKKRYYYAKSKEMAEEIVKQSRLNYAIVRPTIVLAEQAPIWKALSNLARKRIIMMIGDGRTKIQPISIEDLIDCLLTIIDDNLFGNRIYELGGPDIISFEDFLKRIHRVYYGTDATVLHIPLNPISILLSLAEKFSSALPLSAGQLSSFNNDGTIESNPLFQRQRAKMKSIESMIKECIRGE